MGGRTLRRIIPRNQAHSRRHRVPNGFSTVFKPAKPAADMFSKPALEWAVDINAANWPHAGATFEMVL